jgi:hypothetical protein
LCWASTHGFDPGFSGEPEGAPPDDRRGAGGPGREEEEIIATSEEGGGERDQQREPAPADRRLIRAARQLFRRAAGLADGPQGASDCGADSVRPG